MKKEATIINPFNPIPNSDRSHVRGWAMIWEQRLNSELTNVSIGIKPKEKYNFLAFDHGVNFSGGLNLFGGFTDKNAEQCQDLIDRVNNGSELYSLDWNMNWCNYIESLRARIGKNSSSNLLTQEMCDSLEEIFDKSETITMEKMFSSGNSRKLIIGDSHTVAFSKETQMISKINGQLLYSALQEGLVNFIEKNSWSLFKNHNKKVLDNITLCLGSIDIRFHCVNSGRDSAKKFAQLYSSEIKKASDYFQTDFTVCAPVPVEHEDRKIPKTGQYKGNNFVGSRKERLKYTLDFINELEKNFLDFCVLKPPIEWYEMDGKKYAEKIMELNSSVHIAPKNYNSITDWGTYGL